MRGLLLAIALGFVLMQAVPLRASDAATIETSRDIANQIVRGHLPERLFENVIVPTLDGVRDTIANNAEMQAMEKEFPGIIKHRTEAADLAYRQAYRTKFDEAVRDIENDMTTKFANPLLHQAIAFYQKPHVAKYLAFVRAMPPCPGDKDESDCRSWGAALGAEYFANVLQSDKEDWAQFYSSEANAVDDYLSNLVGIVLSRFEEKPLTAAELDELNRQDQETVNRFVASATH